MYCITVLFETAPHDHARFLARVARQAADSLEREPGCRQFDVWSAPDRPGQVYLYEVYDDRAAFEAHLASAHFADFDRQVAPLVAAKTVTAWEHKA